jgi:polysaccharide export outer membrane protein
MRHYRYFFWFLLLPLILSCSSKKTSEEIFVNQGEVTPPAPFVLGVGDKISFSVWRHEDLAGTVLIDPSGDISLPLVGEIKASGLTVSQLREEIRLRLSKYIINPKVDVNVSTLSSQNVYVLGEVNAPGSFSLNRNMVIWDAISLAEGFTEDASKEGVLLVRNENGVAKVSMLNLDIQEVFENGGALPDYSIKNRDLIYVPPSTIADIERFMVRLENIIRPILNLERGIIMTQPVRDVLQGKKLTGGVIY